MKTTLPRINYFRRLLDWGPLCLAIFLFMGSVAHAGLIFDLHLIRFGHGQSYRFFNPLDTNSTPPSAAFGTYYIYSPHYLAQGRGSWRQMEITAGGATTIAGGEDSYPDFNSLMDQLTNGVWTIAFTNATATNIYNFNVSAPTATSNMLPSLVITYPTDGQLEVPNHPTFTWQGPAGFAPYSTNTSVGNYDGSFAQSITLPPGQTNWTPDPFPNGVNLNFNLAYITNTPLIFNISTPLNINSPHDPIAGWEPFTTFDTGDSVSFAITNPPVDTATMIAHYSFEDANNLGHDASGNHYDLDFNGGNGVTTTNDAKMGSGAAYFDGSSFLSYNSTPSNLLSAIAGDFSIAFWIKTSQDEGNEDGEAWAGEGIVSADLSGQRFDLVPAALDGGQIGFNTGPDDATVNTHTNVNEGNYHHVVITRKQKTGEKRIYIDGVLDNSDFSTVYPLSDPHLIAIGCAIDASQFDPFDADPRQFFQGQLDDLRVYSGVLTPSQVSLLYADVGSTLVAHYAFDDGGNIGLDSSGNGFDLDFNGGEGDGVSLTSDSKAGGHSADFDGGSFLSYIATPSPVLNAFAGSFTLSFWIKTSSNDGGEGEPAWAGQGIVNADIPFNANDVVPAALDGRAIGFNVGVDGSDNTLNSDSDIPQDGNFHHVVITRNQSTGNRQIYIDGTLNTSDTATTNLLNDPVMVAVGCAIDASQADPNDANPYQYFQGQLDDLQIYSQVLNPSEITFLFGHPGLAVSTSAGGGHRNVGHYTFDDGGNPGHDSSGQGNDITIENSWGPQHQFSSDNIAGGGAARFFGTDALSANQPILSNLNALLAGSFSFSVWVKTTVSNGSDDNDAFSGGVIFWAYNDHNNTNDTIPLSITGSKAAFSTRDHLGHQTTLHSITSVNDGNYHLLTVTRDHSTGEKKMYVDGNFETAEIGTTDPLNGNNYFISINGFAYFVGDSGTNFSSYNGLLDDLQIYSGVLSADDVSFLYNHQGSTVSDDTSVDFNPALNTTGLTWTSGGDTTWFVETSVTHDGTSAAQSGAIGDGKATRLEAAAPATGQVSFYWKVSSETNFDFLHFYINDAEQDAISGQVDWTQKSYLVSAGDLLRWEYTKDADCCSDGLDAGFLDQVDFSAVPTVITVNPFDQTNRPGYGVALVAAASGSPNPTFQWFKVGVGAISGATNTLYVPTNSGNASVAGNYYAIASNIVNSAITTTAIVSFVSAPLPPDWARAFKSPFQAQDSEQVISDFYFGITFDGSVSNNIYTATEFGGNVTFGALQLSSGPNNAAAVVKQTTNGSPLWVGAITNNGTGSSSGRTVAPAPGGGVYLSGNLNGTNFINGTPLPITHKLDIFLTRFDANGAPLWTKMIGGTNDDFIIINSLASDSTGNVTISGLLGPGPVSLESSNYNITGQQGLVAQYDPAGALRWARILPGEFAQYVTYNAGRLYLGMNTAGGTNLIFGTTTNVTDRNWALVCLNDNDGQLIWARGIGVQSGNNQPNPYATGVIDDVPRIAVSGPDVFLTGVAYDTNAAFGPFTVNFPLPRGIYFARYDTNGNAQLATTYGSVTTSPLAAVADSAGNVYISGDFDTDAFFGQNLLAGPINRRQSGSFSQAFLAKFDRNGNSLWARPAISPATVNFRSLGLSPDGVWAAGYCISTNTSSGYTPTAFGTNFVFSDTQAIVSGSGVGASVTFTGYPAGVLAKVGDNVTVIASPITLANSRNNGTNFQFSFQTQSGFTHSVQYRTNLISGLTWQTYSNVVGDGSLQIIPIPYSVFSPSKAGFVRVMTQ